MPLLLLLLPFGHTSPKAIFSLHRRHQYTLYRKLQALFRDPGFDQSCCFLATETKTAMQRINDDPFLQSDLSYQYWIFPSISPPSPSRKKNFMTPCCRTTTVTVPIPSGYDAFITTITEAVPVTCRSINHPCTTATDV